MRPAEDLARTWRAVEQLMGMPISIALRGRHATTPDGHDAWQAVLADLRHVDRVFSTYRTDSVVSRIDRDELSFTDAPPELTEVLVLGEQARVASRGAFDIWRTGPDGWLHLDPSGVVKGWAVQRAARHLRELDDTDHCLSAGGDLVAHVADPDRPAWQVGIEDPHAPQRILARVPLRHEAIATSSQTHRGPHITDARSGSTPQRVAQVTVIADDLTWADIDATAAFALGPQAHTWLQQRPGRRGIVVWADGSTDIVAPAGSDPLTSATATAAGTAPTPEELHPCST